MHEVRKPGLLLALLEGFEDGIGLVGRLAHFDGLIFHRLRDLRGPLRHGGGDLGQGVGMGTHPLVPGRNLAEGDFGDAA